MMRTIHLHLEETMNLEELKDSIVIEQKKGLPYIITSVVIWSLIIIVSLLDIPVMTRNLLVFCCATPLLPLSYLIGKLLKVDIFSKDNPLSKLGLLFTLNQLLYLLIVMWVYRAVPEKKVMVYAMVFGAHLFPYPLFKSKTINRKDFSSLICLSRPTLDKYLSIAEGET